MDRDEVPVDLYHRLMACERTGPGGALPWFRHSKAVSGPTVVLTHGAGTDHRMFDELVSRLSDRGVGTIVWDVRGHGASDLRGRAFTICEASCDLINVLDAEGVTSPVVLLGQSMGGNISQDVLRRSPERVRALIAIGSTSNTLPISTVERIGLRAAGPLLRLIPFDWLVRMMAEASSTTDDGRAYLCEVFRMTGRRNFVKIWSGTSRSVTPDSTYSSPIPQLLVVGECDGMGNIRRAMSRWAERDPSACLVSVPGAGHVAQLDRPHEVNTVIADFIDALPDEHHEPTGPGPRAHG